MWRLIWGNDHLYCGFGARRSHLTLHWMSAQGSVWFRWGTITGPYHANFSQVETQKFDPHWFYCLQWGCNNLFCQECTNSILVKWQKFFWRATDVEDSIVYLTRLEYDSLELYSREIALMIPYWLSVGFLRQLLIHLRSVTVHGLAAVKWMS